MTGFRTAAALLFLLSAAARAQDRASISGTVTDPAGGRIPATAVSVANRDTGVQYGASSNEAGLYAVPNLPPGVYTIRFQAPGFKAVTRNNVELQVAQTAQINVQLEVGDTNESVTVTAEAPLLTTDKQEVSVAVSKAELSSLPISTAAGRNPAAFASKLGAGIEGGEYTMRVNGSTPGTTDALLDGASTASVQQSSFVESYVSIEALREFKIQTSGLSAEYGRTAGGVMNFVMRSGTNTPHGSVFYTMRNEAFNANNFTNNARGQKRSVERRNNFGGSFGGPIYLPRVYDGRNRTFFFFSLEHTRDRIWTFQPTRSVPQPEMWTGDLSRLLTAQAVGTDYAGRSINRGQIYDPRTERILDGRRAVDPFTGNIIPRSRISGVSSKVAEIALRHYRPISSGLTQNSLFPALTSQPEFNQDQYSIKLDHSFSERSKISGSYVRGRRPRVLVDNAQVWDVNEPLGGPFSGARNQVINTRMARVAHDLVLTPSLLNLFQVSLNRYINPNKSWNYDGGCAAMLGITGVSQTASCPVIDLGGGGAGVTFNRLGDVRNSTNATVQLGLQNTITWLRGKHNMRSGIDFRRSAFNYQNFNNLAGTFAFSAPFTGYTGRPDTGHAFASFLLGEVYQGSVGVPDSTGAQQRYYAAFFQDDYKLTSRVTLNLGLRYEYEPVMTEPHDRTTNFDVNAIDPVTGLRGALVFAGPGPGRTGSRTFAKPDKTNFGPRIGFAVAAGPKTTIRGGYGLVYAGAVFTLGLDPIPSSVGFVRSNSIISRSGEVAAFNWDRGYPGNFVAGKLDAGGWRGATDNVVAWNPGSGRIPYFQQWNFNIQREAPGSFVVDLGYLGNKGGALWNSDLEQLNQLDPKYLDRYGANLNTRIASDADAQRYGLAKLPYPGFSGELWRALVPYPQLAASNITLNSFRAPLGFSTYHSFQAAVNRRYSRGLVVNASYVLSKNITNTESSASRAASNSGRPLDAYHLALEKSIADDDRTHAVKIGMIYDLPLGKGKRFFNRSSRVLDGILGGWQLSYIGFYGAGSPVRVTGSGIPGWNGRANRPDLINPAGASLLAGFSPERFNFDGISAGDRVNNQYFRREAFLNVTDPQRGGLYRLGNAGFTTNLREPWSVNEDIGLRKAFRIHEGVRAELRADAFNAFNRHSFGGLITDVSNAKFGQFTSVGGSRTLSLGARLEF